MNNALTLHTDAKSSKLEIVMAQTDKQNFRALCLREHEHEQAIKEMARKEQEDKDNAERQEKLVTFLKLHLLDESIDAEKLGVKDAIYQDDRFVLTVGSREKDFPIMAGVMCSQCKEVFGGTKVSDFAQIGAVMSLANQLECPNCDDDDEDDFESSSRISSY